MCCCVSCLLFVCDVGGVWGYYEKDGGTILLLLLLSKKEAATLHNNQPTVILYIHKCIKLSINIIALVYLLCRHSWLLCIISDSSGIVSFLILLVLPKTSLYSSPHHHKHALEWVNSAIDSFTNRWRFVGTVRVVQSIMLLCTSPNFRQKNANHYQNIYHSSSTTTI